MGWWCFGYSWAYSCSAGPKACVIDWHKVRAWLCLYMKDLWQSRVSSTGQERLRFRQHTKFRRASEIWGITAERGVREMMVFIECTVGWRSVSPVQDGEEGYLVPVTEPSVPSMWNTLWFLDKEIWSWISRVESSRKLLTISAAIRESFCKSFPDGLIGASLQSGRAIVLQTFLELRFNPLRFYLPWYLLSPFIRFVNKTFPF